MPASTEYAKMLAGERYNCLDPDLAAPRQTAKALLRIFNAAEPPAERQAALLQLLGGLGSHSMIEPPFYYSYGHSETKGLSPFF